MSGLLQWLQQQQQQQAQNVGDSQLATMASVPQPGISPTMQDPQGFRNAIHQIWQRYLGHARPPTAPPQQQQYSAHLHNPPLTPLNQFRGMAGINPSRVSIEFHKPPEPPTD